MRKAEKPRRDSSDSPATASAGGEKAKAAPQHRGTASQGVLTVFVSCSGGGEPLALLSMPVRLLRRLRGTACGRPSGRWLAHKGVPLPQTPTLPQTRFIREDDATRKRRRLPRAAVPRRHQRKKTEIPRRPKTKAAPQLRGAAFPRALRRRTTSPPRAWGRLLRGQLDRFDRRNTLTGVGKTEARDDALRLTQKHPHGRGEDAPAASRIWWTTETPPRAWGRRPVRMASTSVRRNTPTGVGKTVMPRSAKRRPQKHPHGRGEDNGATNVL